MKWMGSAAQAERVTSTDSRSLLSLTWGKCEKIKGGKLLIANQVQGSESAKLITVSATGPLQITKDYIFPHPNALSAQSTLG